MLTGGRISISNLNEKRLRAQN